MKALNAPPTDISVLTDALEVVLDRFSKRFGTSLAVVAHATILALAYSYQGIIGMVAVFVLAVVFAGVCIRSGRNLRPVIVAHGIVDSIGITMIYPGHSDVITGNWTRQSMLASIGQTAVRRRTM